MNRNTIPRHVTGRYAVAWLVLAASLILASPLADACMCAAFPDDEAKAAAIAFAQADVIFVGVVTEIRRKRLQPLTVRDATFDVLKVWKGLKNRDPVVVRSADGSIACGYKFKKSGDYLVFAYWDVEHPILTTSMCELTRKASRARGLVRELDRIKQGENPLTDKTPISE